jgi:hypothetical protein
LSRFGSPLEAWVWTQIQVGKLADVDQYHHDDHSPPSPADPGKPEHWQDGRRRLSAFFLETILLKEAYRSATHDRGVRIQGAWFEEEIDLRDAELHCPLWLRRSRFEKKVDFTDLRARFISMDGSHFAGRLSLARAVIGMDLSLRAIGAERIVCDGELDLSGVNVSGEINLRNAKIESAINFQNAKIGIGLYMTAAEFQDTDLGGVKVGGELALVGAKVSGDLNLEDGDIGQSLLMWGRAEEGYCAAFQNVCLRSTRVGGLLNLTGATINGALDLRRADIREDLICIGGEFQKINLAGARIRGELVLAPPMPDWRRQDGKDPRLNLRNASCDAFRDGGQAGAWPNEIELEGFTYKRIGGLGAAAESDVAKRGPKWFIDWLGNDSPFTRQPYHQCASVLREMGHPEMANDVLYEGRERERHELWAPWPSEQGRGLRARFGRSLRWLKTMLFGRHPFPWHEEIRRSFRWFGLFLLAFVVGYGYGTRLFWRPLASATLIVAIGIRVTYSDPSAFTDSSIWWRTFFSLDMLLAIVELSREHTLVQAGLDGFAYGWFVIQNLLGWVLALFLIAGLTGLTK